MLLTALFIAQATAEWVEISQQHYRKPLRTYHFTTPAKIIDVEGTTRPWVYNNRSVSEYSWNRNNFDPKHGQHATVTELDKDPLSIEHELKIYNNGLSKGDHYNEVERKIEPAKRVPNIGIVRRVQLSDSPPKSPIQLNRRDKHPYINADDESNSDRDNDDINDTNIQHNNNGVLGNGRNLQTTLRIPVVNNKNVNHFNLNPPGNSLKNVFVTEDFEDNEKLGEEQQIKNEKSTESTFKDVKVVSETTKRKDNNNGQPMLKNEDKGIPRTDGIADDLNTKSTNEDRIKQVNSNQMQKNKEIHSTKAETVNTIENLMRFLTVVADTISKNSRRNFNGKIRYLQELKETILRNIADRIDATWPDDDVSGGARRRSRSAQAEPRGHVQFPSSESSLMTISFLTFAVFLIKLVLQVIQTYKNKTMMVAPLVVAAGRAAYARHKHNN